MPAEEMGKLSRGLRLAFAISSVAFVAILAISPVKDLRREWKQYKRSYVRFAQTRPDTKRLLADYHSDIDQIWIPSMNVVDRCTSCHQAITQPSLADRTVPQPFRAHPPIPHRPKEWGCTVCHRGQGPATEVAEAHETTLAWEQPMLANRFIQASCGTCHRADLPETPKLNRGRRLLGELHCVGCHRLQDVERPAMLGPDLTNIGTKVTREWIYKWLKEPQTLTDKDGNITVNGYETEEEPRMPKFRLTEQELRSLSAYLSTLRSKPIEAYRFAPRAVAALTRNPDVAQQGEVRFRQMFCSTCHSLAVTRAGETKLIGGDIGPELTKVGSKVNPDWLVAWLRNPQSYLPHSKMPRYQWSDEDLYSVTQYIRTRLTDSDLLSNVPQLGAPAPEELQAGRRLFVEKGCGSCHVIEGINPQKDFGPDLSALGAKNVSELEFGRAAIPRSLISYVQAKLTDPVSVNPAARMPQYALNAADLDALTTALLSMTGSSTPSGIQKLMIPRKDAAFHPAGAFGEVYERVPQIQRLRRRPRAGPFLRRQPRDAPVARGLFEKPANLAPHPRAAHAPVQHVRQGGGHPCRLLRHGAAESGRESRKPGRQALHAADGRARQTTLRSEISVPGVSHDRRLRRIRRPEPHQRGELADAGVDFGVAEKSAGAGAGHHRAAAQLHRE